jgi:hypothetical protein
MTDFTKCGTTFVKQLTKIGDDFIKNKKVKRLLTETGADDFFANKFYQKFHRPLSEWRDMKLGKGDLDNFQRELNLSIKSMESGKIASAPAEAIYATSSLVKRNPILAETLNDYLKVNHTNKGNSIILDKAFKRMMDHLSTEAVANEMYKEIGGKGDFKRVLKKAQRFQKDLQNIAEESWQGKVNANELTKLMSAEEAFLVKGEGRVLYDFVNAIEVTIPKLEKTVKEYLNAKEASIEKGSYVVSKTVVDRVKADLRKEIKSPAMQDALLEYIDMMSTGYTVASKGVDAYVQSIIYGMESKGYNPKDPTMLKLKDLKSQLKEQFLPKQILGYYPHYGHKQHMAFLDGLMPKLEELSLRTRESLERGDLSIDTAIEQTQSFLSGRLKPRIDQSVDPNNYSFNAPASIKRYLDEVNRFNFIAHTTKETRKALVNAKKMFREGKDLSGYGTSVTDMILDLHSRQTGLKRALSPEAEAGIRTLLNLEFISKLGFNIRSGLKNASQALLNYVEYGGRTIRKSREFYSNDPDMSRLVDKLMIDSGIKFEELTPELLEIQGSSFGRHTVKEINGKYQIEFTKPGLLSDAADMTSWAAGKSGVIMRKVENMNRKGTFRIGFAKMYMELKNSTIARQNFIDRYKKRTGKEPSETQIENEVIRRSRNYALNMTTLLHFDYSAVSKSRAMNTTFGRFALQFQHFSHKFFEYNMGMAKDSWGDIKNMEFFGQNAKKSYRMGLVYGMAPVVASLFTGLDFGRVIEHDAAGKLNQIKALLSGDDEEYEKAFYGRGALTGVLSMPLFTDVLKLAELAQLYELDENGLMDKIIGFKDYSSESGDEKLHALVRVLSTQLGRGLTQTAPMIANSHLGTAMQMELGLYPTSDAKSTREYFNESIGMLSPDLETSLNELMGLSSKKKGKKKNRPIYRTF